jgi:hypothetical protein
LASLLDAGQEIKGGLFSKDHNGCMSIASVARGNIPNFCFTGKPDSYNNPNALTMVTCGSTGINPEPPKFNAGLKNPSVDPTTNQFPLLL